MAQTPVIREASSNVLDYIASADKTAGEVVIVGTIPMVVVRDIDYSENTLGGLSAGEGEVWLMPQAAEVLTGGDAVYWDADGNPYGGTAGSGCATGTATGNNLIGTVAPLQTNGTVATANTDSYVRVIPNAAKRTATIAGSVTADDVVGSDTTLTITGKQGTASAVGGTLVLTAGAGGVTTGAGGAASLVGGAATNDNCAGGAVTINGGAGNGTGAAGAIVIGSTAASITLGKMPRIPVTALTAGGTAIGNANAVSEGFNVVAGANDTAAVILPTAVAGAQVIIKTTVAGKNLIVFPAVNGTINNVGPNNAYNMVADEGCSMFIASNATQWYSLPLVSS